MTYFDKQAHQYDLYSGVQKVVAKKLLFLCHKKPYKSILDLGCGTGHLTYKLAYKYPDAQIFALDQSANMLSYLKHPRITTQKEDVETFTPQKKFDLIISNFCFQWLANPLKQIKRYKQYLAKDGQLLISIPNNDSFKKLNQSYKECKLTPVNLEFIKNEKLKNELSKMFIISGGVINSYYTTTQDFYRNLHKIGAKKNNDLISEGQLRKLIKYHNSKSATPLINISFYYSVITSKNT